MKTILLHGLGQTSSSWKNTINTMGKSADILCPNLFDWFEDKEVCYQVLYLAFSEYCKQFSEPVNICGLSLGGCLGIGKHLFLQVLFLTDSRFNGLQLGGAAV